MPKNKKKQSKDIKDPLKLKVFIELLRFPKYVNLNVGTWKQSFHQ